MIQQLREDIVDTLKKQFESDDYASIAQVVTDNFSGMDSQTWIQSITHSTIGAGVLVMISIAVLGLVCLALYQAYIKPNNEYQHIL